MSTRPGVPLPIDLGTQSAYNVRSKEYHTTITEDMGVWDIYNQITMEADRLLVALYLAVVTPIAIEATKQTRDDPAEKIRDILLVISRQLANSSTPPFEDNDDTEPLSSGVIG
ncbi:4425_t:CDS:2, partial [Acaulospora colombiana]